jgi:hypothetical protein
MCVYTIAYVSPAERIGVLIAPPVETRRLSRLAATFIQDAGRVRDHLIPPALLFRAFNSEDVEPIHRKDKKSGKYVLDPKSGKRRLYGWQVRVPKPLGGMAYRRFDTKREAERFSADLWLRKASREHENPRKQGIYAPPTGVL